MKATDLTGCAPGGPRVPLAERVPLPAPFVVEMFPVYACNFRCRYCYQAVEEASRGYISNQRVMPFELFQKCVEDLRAFPEQIKTLRIAGLGEPLMHRDVVKMVECAVASGCAQNVELITNGSLLTPKISDGLIRAGLSRMIVSLQGTGAEAYRRTAGMQLDFDRFVEGLRYFCQHKKSTHVYCKVVDCALSGEEDRRRFFEIFGDLCDSIAVETAVPIMGGVEYGGLLKPSREKKTQFGLRVVEHEICPIPFYYLWVNPDGKVVPCNNINYPAIVGDATQASLAEIWKGAGYRRFQCAMLDGLGQASEACRKCEFVRYRSFVEDGLKVAVGRLKKQLEVEETE